jgi:2-oxo-4-hydroxy-4-carboxy-5-ureidoimidazoline decarboxylase
MTNRTNMQLAAFNTSDAETAAAMVLPCNGSAAWAALLAGKRPYTDVEQLLATSDAIWSALPPDDWQQAFDSHPRIGERHAKAASEKSLAWSKGEQAAAQLNEATQGRLAAANRAYEARFGRIFLICATGRSTEAILAALERRMQNDDITELHEAAEQQRQITQLRLRKWLEPPA